MRCVTTGCCDLVTQLRLRGTRSQRRLAWLLAISFTMRTALSVFCSALALTASTCFAQPAPVPPPPIPSGLKCGGGSGATAGAHRLSWAPLASADVYEVEVGLSEASAVHTPLASTTTATPTVSLARSYSYRCILS